MCLSSKASERVVGVISYGLRLCLEGHPWKVAGMQNRRPPNLYWIRACVLTQSQAMNSYIKWKSLWQDMPPQNMALWHIEYFKMKYLWSSRYKKDFSPLSEADHNPLVRGALFIPGWKEHPYFQDRDTKRNPNTQALLTSLTYYIHLTPSLSPCIFPPLFTLHQIWHKNHFLGSSFPQ